MIKLTKRYRLIWGDDGQVKFDWRIDHKQSTTYPGEGLHYYESDNLAGVEATFLGLGLTETNYNIGD